MNKTPVSAISGLPEALKKYVRNASLFDSSCSDAARVWFSHIDGGFYIKSAPPGSLKEEAEMTAFFHSRKLGAEVLDYLSLERDWLVTRAVPGEDCLHSEYRNDPKRLSETLGRLLRQLHETDPAGCPYSHRNHTRYAHIPADFRQQYPDFLTGQVLLHGDYCLPNGMLHDWEVSGLIDVDSGGIGDRHIDLYWGCWSILYNLKEERWCSRFLDAYGREDVDIGKLRILDAFETYE